MSTWDLIGIITLGTVLIVGISLKLLTQKKLNDLDGLDSMFIVKEEDGAAIPKKTGSK